MTHNPHTPPRPSAAVPAKPSATDWVPALPPKVARRVDVFTPHRDGFVRKHGGDALFVLGRGKFLAALGAGGATAAVELLEAEWDRRRDAADAAGEDQFAKLRASGGLLLIHVVAEYFAHLDHRVATGRPKRMEPTTAWDYKRTLNELGRVVGPDRPVNDLGPGDFARYAKAIAADAASSYARKVAYVHAFLRWALLAGKLGNNRCVRELTPGMDPLRSLIGPDLQKPSRADLRDERVVKEKSLTPAEIGKIWHVADDREKLWVALGVNCAFDNGDVMGLSWRVVVPASSYRGVLAGNAGLVVDYRRRKRGRVRRVVPLVPEVGCRLADHLAVGHPDAEPADDDLVFLGRDGRGLSRMSASGPQNIVTRTFARLMVRAGVRPAPVVTRDDDGRVHVRTAGSGDGRGYRSLRTTFSNLAPTGFRDEIEIVTGHAHGQVILDSYMETHGFSRLHELVSAVWERAFSERPDGSWSASRPAPARPAAGGRPTRSTTPPGAPPG